MNTTNEKIVTFDTMPAAVDEILRRQKRFEEMVLSILDNKAANSPELLNIEQAAKIVNLAVPTMYGLTRRREIPHSRKNKRLYFDKQELIDWIKTGRKQTISELQENPEQYLKPQKIRNT